VPDGAVPEAPLVPVSLDVPVALLESGDDMLELLPLSPDVPILSDDDSVPVMPDIPELPLPMVPVTSLLPLVVSPVLLPVGPAVPVALPEP
jgi:hypothetical protein